MKSLSLLKGKVISTAKEEMQMQQATPMEGLDQYLRLNLEARLKHLLTLSDNQKSKSSDKAVTRRSEEGKARAAKEQTAKPAEAKSIKQQSIEV